MDGVADSLSTGIAGSPAAPGAEAPPVVAPPPGHPRFPLIDSLRALAALGVLFAHVGFLSQTIARHRYGAGVANLSIGVAVFFAISGFLLYRPFFNSEITAAPRPPATDFLRRRVLRIVPAYWLALTVLAIYPGLPVVHTHEWWRYYFFLQVYSPLFAIFGLTVAWSLCIEVTFYALLPLYAALTRLLCRRLTPLGRVRFQLSPDRHARSGVVRASDRRLPFGARPDDRRVLRLVRGRDGDGRAQRCPAVPDLVAGAGGVSGRAAGVVLGSGGSVLPPAGRRC